MRDAALQEAFRIALVRPEARECLTDHQRKVYEAFLDEDGNVSAVARRLKITRQAVQNAMRLCGNKFLDFAKGATGR